MTCGTPLSFLVAVYDEIEATYVLSLEWKNLT